MIEVHDKNSGSVTNGCQCTPGETYTTPVPLPEECYSPSGTNCEWYNNCLEKKHPCEQTDDAYALTFAEKFCNLYADNYFKFTRNGRNWIDAVRKCLQVALVPFIRPFENPTCEEIKETAFDSHTKCYLEPYPGAPSMCDLPISDWWRVFWTVKGSLTSTSSFIPSLMGMFEVGNECTHGLLKLTLALPPGMRIIKFAIRTFQLFSRPKRSALNASLNVTVPLYNNTAHRYAGLVTEAIAKKLNFDTSKIDWFAFSDDSRSEISSHMTLSMMLADKAAFITTTTTPGSTFNQPESNSPCSSSC